MRRNLGTKMALPLALAGCAIFAVSNGISAYGATVHGEDHLFAMRAAQNDLAEVHLGNLAQVKSLNPAVKALGRRMVEDGSKANSQLKTVASEDHIALPSQPSQQEKVEYEKLAEMSGTEFDRAYARAMVRDHKEDISEFKDEASQGGIRNIKEFASSRLPILQDDSGLIQNMERSVSGASATGNGQ